jgi:hypothetical protein
MDLQELRSEIEQQAALMVSVATGGPQIESVQSDYIERRDRIAQELKRLRADDPNPFRDLWAWYGYYSQRLPRWHERRTFIRELYDPLYAKLDALAEQDIGTRLEGEADRTGWERVDDQIVQLRRRYAVALTVEDFQAVGLLCRDIFVSLSEAVFAPERHVPTGSQAPATLRDTLFAVVQHEASGAANKELRALLKANIDYANKVQHDRTATRNQARAVAEATIATVTLIRVLGVVSEDAELEAMREAWTQTVLPMVEMRSIPTAAMLREARPVAYDQDRIVIAFPPAASFHRQLAEQPKNVDLLREALATITGRELDIEFLVEEESA